MEPEDKTEWLRGRELSEINQERDSLQLKIDNLETFLDMLIIYVEGSHKKISELNAAVLVVKSEKEFFFENLKMLGFQYFILRNCSETMRLPCGETKHLRMERAMERNSVFL